MKLIEKREDGSIVLNPDEDYINADGSVKESFYHEEMFMYDLYLEQLPDTNWYLVDNNSERLYYRGSYLLQNPLKDLLEDLENAPLTLKPEENSEYNRMRIRKLYEEDSPCGKDFEEDYESLEAGID